jgi:hypothetical protein
VLAKAFGLEREFLQLIYDSIDTVLTRCRAEAAEEIRPVLERVFLDAPIGDLARAVARQRARLSLGLGAARLGNTACSLFWGGSARLRGAFASREAFQGKVTGQNRHFSTLRGDRWSRAPLQLIGAETYVVVCRTATGTSVNIPDPEVDSAGPIPHAADAAPRPERRCAARRQ